MYSYTTYIIPHWPGNYLRLQTVNAFFLFPCWRIWDSFQWVVWCDSTGVCMHLLILRQAVLFKAPSNGCRKWGLWLRGTTLMSPEKRKWKKKASHLVRAQLGKQGIPACNSFSWANRRKKKPTGYCVTERSVWKLSLIRKQTVLWCQPCKKFKLQKLSGVSQDKNQVYRRHHTRLCWLCPWVSLFCLSFKSCII